MLPTPELFLTIDVQPVRFVHSNPKHSIARRSSRAEWRAWCRGRTLKQTRRLRARSRSDRSPEKRSKSIRALLAANFYPMIDNARAPLSDRPHKRNANQSAFQQQSSISLTVD